MPARDPAPDAGQERIFSKAPFIRELGIRLKGLGSGWCESSLEIQPRHLQQDDVIHAGVMATMADHTAGGAAATLVKGGEIVLTIEFKINILRPARGRSLRCKAVVLRPGSRVTVAESEVFSQEGEKEVLVAKAMVTLAVVVT
ncbi:MAG TPA: PaaI family thioesterase [bacterium]|nr:PaaI family thioesterase [bacterium]